MILLKGVEKMDNTKTGQFIKNLRTEKGLTQQELAEKLNCTNKAISRWETGSGSPDIDFLVPLAEILGVTVNELLAGERISEDNILQKSDEVIIDTMKKSKKQNDKRQWDVFAMSCLLQVLIIPWLAFDGGVYIWVGVSLVSLFMTVVFTLISSKKLRVLTLVTNVIIYSVFTLLAEETALYIIVYSVTTAILSQIMFAIKEIVFPKLLKKYKKQTKKKQRCIFVVLILILVVIVGVSAAAILEYTHVLWIWQDINFIAPPTKQMLEEQADKEGGSIVVYGEPKIHYFKATVFPWESEQKAMKKIELNRKNNDISAEYLVEYGYWYGYFEVEHEVVETNFDIYKYWLKGSPNGAKWLVTVDCSENGYNITYEKFK